jgi:hypothetical protein
MSAIDDLSIKTNVKWIEKRRGIADKQAVLVELHYDVRNDAWEKNKS